MNLSTSFAAKLTCDTFGSAHVASGTRSNGDIVYVNDGDLDDYALYVYDEFKILCNDRIGKEYILSMQGIGPGIRYTGFNRTTLRCPNVKQSKLAGVYGGVKISAGVVVGGIKAGIVANKKLGTCLLTGLEVLSIGASVTIGKLEIIPVD